MTNLRNLVEHVDDPSSLPLHGHLVKVIQPVKTRFKVKLLGRLWHGTPVVILLYYAATDCPGGPWNLKGQLEVTLKLRHKPEDQYQLAAPRTVVLREH